MRVAILFDDVDARAGATPDERGVLEAVDAAEEVLAAQEHQVVRVPAGGEIVEWSRLLEAARPDVVLNLCEGLAGSSHGEVRAARIVERMGIPMTGSSSRTLDFARGKDRVNTLLEAAEIPVPPWCLFRRERGTPYWRSFPAIVKPAREDGSVGITGRSVVEGPEDLARALEDSARYGLLMIQAFVGTRELNVGIVGEEVLPVSEIDFSDLPPGLPRLVSYSAKWNPGSAEEQGTRPICPAPLPPSLAERAVALARRAWALVGGRGYGRIDLRLREPDTLFVLEVNPNPDLAPSAGLARMARERGWDYAELVERIIRKAAT